MYRRFTSLLLVVVFVLSLTACKKETTDVKAPEKVIAPVEETIVETIPGVAEIEDEIIDPRTVSEPQDEDRENQELVGESVEPDKKEDKNPTSTTESFEPTESIKSTESTDSTEATEITEPVKESAPTQPTEEVQKPSTETVLTDYERYNAMSGEEQMAFIESFGSIEAFVKWHNNAKAEYEALHPDIEIGDGVIDAGDLIG